MASQIAHIVYAQKYFSAIESGRLADVSEAKYPTGKINKEEFILGTIFPDIRFIDDSVKRKDTHLKFYPVNLDFLGLNSFFAGWKFHLYCDMRREEILNKYDFYSLDKAVDLYGRPAKFLEDEIIYDSYDNWEKVYNYFNDLPRLEEGLPVNQDTLNLWYAIMASYIKQKPDQSQIEIVISKLVNLPNKKEVAAAVSELRKNKKAIKILDKVKDEII